MVTLYVCTLSITQCSGIVNMCSVNYNDLRVCGCVPVAAASRQTPGRSDGCSGGNCQLFVFMQLLTVFVVFLASPL